MSDAVTRWAGVRRAIEQAARDSSRDPAGIALVCVSKTNDADTIRPVLAAGQRVFGENRVQEAQGKWPGLRAEFPDLELHLIGPLQSNKARDAVELFDVIETVDRDSVAKALGAALKGTTRRPRFYVQVNIGSEPQKAGVAIADADAFVRACRDTHGLAIEGLMCIPPQHEQASPYFALLAQIAKRNAIDVLSMGMSADFALAIQVGATHVRVGSAIFGERA